MRQAQGNLFSFYMLHYARFCVIMSAELETSVSETETIHTFEDDKDDR